MDIEKVSNPKQLSSMLKGSLYYLFLFTSAGAINPFLYLYIAEQGISGKQIGVLSGMVPLALLLFSTTFSSIADVRGWRVQFLRISLVLAAIFTFLLQFPETFGQFLVILLALAIVRSPGGSIAESLIARTAQRENLNFGGMRLWGSFGFAISAMLFGAVWENTGFRMMFVVASVLMIPQIWIAGKFEEGNNVTKTERGSFGAVLKNKGLMMLLSAVFLSGISNSLSMTYDGIFVRSLGGSNFLIGVMIAFSAFSELPAMFFSQRISKIIRRPNTILLAYVFTTIAYIGYLLVGTPNVLPIFSISKGLGYGLNLTMSIVMLTGLTPEEWSAASQSLMTISWMGLAPLVAGPLGGIILDAFGIRAVYGLGLVAVFIAAIIILSASRRGELS